MFSVSKVFEHNVYNFSFGRTIQIFKVPLLKSKLGNNKKFAIIIQGNIGDYFSFLLESINIYKKIFPNTLIIVSTWEDEDTSKINELKRNNIPYIVVLTHPTSGGVTASFASLGDISIGEPGATVGFAGARVIKDTVRETLPQSFQETEWHLEHSGMIDMVVERKYLRSTIIKLLQILLKKKETQAISDSGDVDNKINTKTFKNQSA